TNLNKILPSDLVKVFKVSVNSSCINFSARRKYTLLLLLFGKVSNKSFTTSNLSAANTAKGYTLYTLRLVFRYSLLACLDSKLIFGNSQTSSNSISSVSFTLPTIYLSTYVLSFL